MIIGRYENCIRSKTFSDNKHSNRKFAKLAKHAEKRAKYGMDSLKKMLMGGRKTAEKFAQQYQVNQGC